MLRPTFDLITHQEHFGPAAQNVLDPEVIAECKKLKRALLTADGELPFSYASEIRKAKIAVFVLSNNHEGPVKWGPRILSAALDMERELAERAKPFCAHISAEGRVTYILRYYRKKVKRTGIQRKDHIEISYEAPTPSDSLPSSLPDLPIEPLQPS